MTDKWRSERFPTAFKLKAIKRAEGGEGVLPVARKLGISRKLLLLPLHHVAGAREVDKLNLLPAPTWSSLQHEICN
jgi:transposase-like protein